jgi:ABC-type uncharacterized transport system permease subunit
MSAAIWRRRQRAFGARARATAIENEVVKGLRHAWGERLQILIELPLFLIFFLLAALLIGRGGEIVSGHVEWRFDPVPVSRLLIGYAAYLFLYLQSAKLFWRLLGEIQAGTLEQVYLSPLPAWLVAAAGRVLATVVETAFLVGVLYAVVYAIVPFHLVWCIAALVPLALLIVASAGYSLIEAGLTLAWKRVEMVHELAIGLLAFFSGAMIPLDRLPAWMAEVGRFAPISQQIIALRSLLVDGRSTIGILGDGGIVWMGTITAAYLTAGVAAFGLGERRARRLGSLGRY